MQHCGIGKPIGLNGDDGGPKSESTLLPMLVSGLLLFVIGALVVMAFV